MTPLAKARALSLIVPLALLGGAYGFQYVWAHLWPCEMCWWQRYAHFAALPFGLAAVLAGPRLKDGGRILVWLAALAIFVSGAIGFYHAGVELKLFPGFTQCTAALTGSPEDMLKAVFDRPMVRCDDVQWSWLGISMAGWNAIVSILSSLAILWLSLGKRKAA
ncbi:disulfide bond formation protein B [Allosphingosinicella sp.]|uniref:disulfide bond formation protein B n=1 Tax=Allosphingosinicella sp. TaxID=2823234 RepID=UPI003783F99D